MPYAADVEISKGIVTNPHRMGGKPTVKGTRITADMVGRLMSGPDPMDALAMIESYPSLSYADLVNAKAFYSRDETVGN